MKRKFTLTVLMLTLGLAAAGCGDNPEGGEGLTYDGNYCDTVVTPDASGENTAGQSCDDDDDCATGLYCDNYNLETTPSCTCRED